ncbi:carboxymuconolactone decarboxylase family protein [Rhodococcus phenolicus]|uniref:carboxymuconolactone decarboxylase family protein n=1 Tax=Rhodococcus phenolicus TaxID=263849 RepID=UPI000834310E|nr:carboxymuconolactone decarboxylase family protein [Rhodococcus phenolicus]
MTRIPPLPVEQWSPEMAAFVSGYRSSVASAGPEQGRASGSNLLGTLARYPELTQSFLTFNSHLLRGTSLSPRQRELLVLRVAAHRGSDYEWAQHVLLARRAGLTDTEIALVADDPGAEQFSPSERSMLAAVDELLDDGTIGAQTWTALSTELDDQQLMDLVFTVGAYSMLAMALRSFGIEPEDELVPHLPAAGKTVMPH